MKVALVSTCSLATPPTKYGGTELVVAALAKGLTQLGHRVTVFATGDSTVAAGVRHLFAAPVWPPDSLAELRHAAFAWSMIARERFDVVHLNHASGLPFTIFDPTPALATIHHERVEALVDHYAAYPQVALVAISARQAALSPEIAIRATIHHGLDPSMYPAGAGAGEYCAFLGRFAPEKAPHLAIAAARSAGVSLRLGGEAHPCDREYFERDVRPLLRSGIEWVGEVDHRAKLSLVGDARALLFPIQWEEPFGLVMIESMLTGTPVISFPCGSAPEVVEDGVTGFLVRSVDEMADRIGRLDSIDRRRCRARAQERWGHLRMAREYLALYRELAARRRETFTPPKKGATSHGGPPSRAG
jgi:glycosyltransferase involved in cell wall biosynthesis